MVDWHDWLRRYEDPDSAHSSRLRTVQRLIERRIDRCAPNPMSVLSICAGDGRDILDILSQRDDAARVRVTLVELDERLCDRARARIEESDLHRVAIRMGDAGSSETYRDLPPADLVILVGVFGNMSNADAKATIEMLPALCARNAIVIWSLRRHPRRQRPDGMSRNDGTRIDRIRRWFIVNDFEETFTNRHDEPFHVGAMRFFGAARPLPAAFRFFTFQNAQEEAKTDGDAETDVSGRRRLGVEDRLSERAGQDRFEIADDPNESARVAWQTTVAALSIRPRDAHSASTPTQNRSLPLKASPLRFPARLVRMMGLLCDMLGRWSFASRR